MPFWIQHRLTIALVAPLAAFFLIGSVFENFFPYQISGRESEPGINAMRYLALVAARVAGMGAIIAAFSPIYIQSFPLRAGRELEPAFESSPTHWPDYWGVITGVIGAAIWISVCHLQIETTVLSWVGLAGDALGQRDAANPFLLYREPEMLGGFLFVRFALLVVAVPIAEELFLRGFLMRAVDSQDWQSMPLTKIGSSGLMAGTVYGVAAHPNEAVAAAIWFSLVTVMMVKTGKFWNCVLAHSITNLILGVYVCQTENWHLW
ncbi:type II CAAX prenyl endopeptidase Rce1 family protein [Planctomycetes bacterium K23_9]|uniref:CAAX amino terminal protease self-immunity n=1 Tax=Stieleria marina TaxID=1930275 RepID=A0A517NPX5_9BACT|nr:CAAX amino terminal protease self- immunity [Planctomycetes bacterium K23_9]